ncbi:PKD domain-containing protein [Herbivorax sp. ANBcel31]|uniref:fibronectin type III domain-containing protein n=1 Tax=Herbivorax sp. ANBcel31 TaxID=3069754 RepID=UPI0027B2D837|nr:PKD domain-containing protein [Herbivorax sp. ANBcel31]MDQ2085630.1 PKD domain-containing protein [Herbivorax sp. ANBcel31]
MEEDNEPPTIPTDLEVTSKTYSTVTLDWTESTDNTRVSGYYILRDGEVVGDTSSTSFTDSRLLPETTYTYTVKAYDVYSNVSDESDSVVVTTEWDTEPPTEPTGLNVTSRTDVSISIEWNASSDNVGVTGYEIYRDGEYLDSTVDTFYSDEGVSPGISYRYTVRAKDAAGNFSSYSRALVISTLLDVEPPTVPTGLTEVSKTAATITFSWEPSTDNIEVAGYKIYRDGNKAGETSETTFTDNELIPDTTYTYTVAAYDEAGNFSLESEVIDITTLIDEESPTVPTNLRISSKSGTSITLAWSESTDNVGVAGYEIYRDGEKVGISTDTIYIDENLEIDQTYNYHVKAFDEAGNVSQKSNTTSDRTVRPNITRITPLAQSTIGGEGNSTMWVYFSNNNNFEGSRAVFEYSQDGEVWSEISNTSGSSSNSNEYGYRFNWDLTDIESGIYHVRFTVYDSSNEKDSFETTYNVNRTAPKAPEIIEIIPGEARITLVWSQSLEGDVTHYRIYRAENSEETFERIAQVSERSNVSYVDTNVEPGKTYYYKVSAVDSYNQEGEKSKFKETTAFEDTTPPEIIGMEPLNEMTFGENATVTVRAQDNVAVSNITLKYRENDEEDWIEIDKINTRSSATFNWDTSNLEGEVTVKAIVADTSGNISDPEFRAYIINTTGPSKVENLRAEPYITDIVLRWDDVPEEDFSYFVVEKKDALDGQYSNIGVINDKLGMQVNNVKPNSNYWFRVTAYDIYGNKGEASDEVEVKTDPDTINPYITSLKPEPGYFAYNIPLGASAMDNVAVESITFQWSTDLDIWNDISTVNISNPRDNASANIDFDVSEFDEGLYYIRAVAVDSAGNISDTESNYPYAEHIVDRTAPAVPEDIEVTNTEGNIRLEWSKGSETNLKYYNVYRSTIKDGQYLLKENNLTSLGFVDRNVSFGGKYFYKVTAVDSAGNESEKSEAVETELTPDTEKPEIVSVYPEDGLELAANPSISILASDNYKLREIYAEYQNEDGEWIRIGGKICSSYSEVFKLNWNTDELSSGIYDIRVTAIDTSFNVSEPYFVSYELKLDTPPKPQLEAVAKGWKIEIEWSLDEAEDIAGYRLYRSDDLEDGYSLIKSTQDTKYIDEPLNPNNAYYYKVEVVDIYGNKNMSDIVHEMPLDTDTIPPIAKAGNDRTAIAGYGVVFDGTSSTDNHMIESYEWDFGDGTVASMAKPVHTYSEPGDYEVTLTVKDPAGNEATDTIRVVVYPYNQVGTVELTVLDEGTGTPVPNAEVYVDFPDDTPKFYVADENGKVNIVAMAGNYNISAYKTDYLPKEVNVPVMQFQTTEETIRLPKGELVVGELTVRRMNLEEIVAAGIDVTAPENQFVYRFNVELVFEQTPLPVDNLYVNGHGNIVGGPRRISIGGGGGGSRPSGSSGDTGGTVDVKAIPNEHPEVPPTLAFLTIPQRVSWLKEFFEVGLTLYNQADPQFVIVDAEATLDLPEGVSLAPTKEAQKPTIKIEELRGQETEEIKWIIRGDEKGYYDLKASFNGTLMPFESPVSAQFETEEPFRVWGGDALRIDVYAQNAAHIGKEYFAHFEVTNTSNFPIYNLSTTFGSYIEPDPVHVIIIDGEKYIIENGEVYNEDGELMESEEEEETDDSDVNNVDELEEINAYSYSGGSSEYGMTFDVNSEEAQKNLPYMQKGDSINTDVLYPGESIIGTYVTIFSAAGDPNEVYYRLIEAFSTTSQGSNTEVSVNIHRIPSHITKYKQNIIDQSSLWGDPVDTTSGAFVTDKEILSVLGSTDISLDIDYNSLHLEEGDFGKGWAHNYEISIEEESDGSIWVHWSPSSSVKFYPEQFINREVTGAYLGNGVIQVSDEYEFKAQDYYPLVHGMEGYVLTRNDDGTYELLCKTMNKYYFDENGVLTKLEDNNGRYITLSRTDDSFTVEEFTSGQSLTIKYNSKGLVESVSDLSGRKAQLKYNENNCLTKIIDAEGYVSTYTYDEIGRILTGTNGDEILYFENEYDEEGRVLVQNDGVEGDNLTYFEYDDESEYWRSLTTVTDRNGNKREYVSNRFGQLIRIEDEMGFETYYTYDEHGNRASVIDGEGNATVYTYDDRGNVLTVSDAEDTQTVMTYDENNNMVSVENANSENTVFEYDENNLLVSSETCTGLVNKYSYNENAQITSHTVEGVGTAFYTYENGKMKTETDFKGNITTYSYDESGRLTSATNGEGSTLLTEFDALDNVISEYDAGGNKTSYTYDSRGNVISSTDPKGNTAYFKYNENDKLIEEIDTKGNITTFEYDAEDRLIKTTDSMGYTSETVYDKAGRALSVTDAQGNITEFTYDRAGRLLSETVEDYGTTTYTYYKNGKLKTITDAMGNTTTYYYDSAWRVNGIENAKGRITTFSYDLYGNVLSETDPLGSTTNYTYDVLGNMLTEEDANGNVTEYEYDENSNLIKVTDALGNNTEYVYDKEDRLVEVIDAKGNSTKMEYNLAGDLAKLTDARGYSVEMEYDELGNMIKTKDAYGVEVLNATYDEMNNLIAFEDALGKKVVNNYDSLGRLVEVIDELNRKTHYSYDEMNRIVSVIDPLGGESKQTFDYMDNLTTLTDPNENVQTFEYDVLGRLITETTAIGSTMNYGYNSLNLLTSMKNGREQETTYKYDDADRLVSFTDEDGTVEYVYDKNDNILEVTDENGTIQREYDALNRVTKYKDFNGNSIEYSYDSVGNLVALTYPGGRIVRYEYDETGRLLKVIDWEDRVTNYEYDNNGRLVKTIRPNDTVFTITYNKAGQIVQQKDVDKHGNIINQYDYTYDEVGNVTVEESSNEPGAPVINNATMTYDKGNRLITYNGNEIKYDEDGNMTYGPLNGEMVDFTYDSRNRLITAGDTEYEYDAENNRTAVIENGLRTEYVNNPHAVLSQLLISKDSEGNETFFIYGLGLIGHEEDNGTYRAYHYDSRGSTTAITDSDGVVTDTYEYAPYGELIRREGDTDTPFLFNGRDGVMTDDNGLYYMRARYYNPEIKRFINQDVLQGNIMDGRSLNRYAYANGSPISLVDPFGLCPELSPSAVGHTILSVIGFVPGIGIVADAINTAWYLAEGNYKMAMLSGISIIPFVGSGIAKGVKWGSKAFKASKISSNIVAQGSRLVNYGRATGRAMSNAVSAKRSAFTATKIGNRVSRGASAIAQSSRSAVNFSRNVSSRVMNYGGGVVKNLGGKTLKKAGKKYIGDVLDNVYEDEEISLNSLRIRGSFADYAFESTGAAIGDYFIGDDNFTAAFAKTSLKNFSKVLAKGIQGKEISYNQFSDDCFKDLVKEMIGSDSIKNYTSEKQLERLLGN